MHSQLALRSLATHIAVPSSIHRSPSTRNSTTQLWWKRSDTSTARGTVSVSSIRTTRKPSRRSRASREHNARPAQSPSCRLASTNAKELRSDLFVLYFISFIFVNFLFLIKLDKIYNSFFRNAHACDIVSVERHWRDRNAKNFMINKLFKLNVFFLHSL